ncbi:hypothetical protein GGF46_005421 [Coemansia sp. RSA 552]|nr:hypothetical protein GGF46_005421 [Coemansia sp. RSA 552]
MSTLSSPDAAAMKSRTGLGLVERIKRMNYQYELVMGLYVMESWEKMVVNTVALVCVVFVVRMVLSSLPTGILTTTASSAMHILA